MNETDFLQGFEPDKQSEPSSPADSPPREAPADAETQDLIDRLVAALCTIYDPEIPVNIYDLGLIYDVQISEGDKVHVVMTLTTPHCPVAETMPEHVASTLRMVEGVGDVDVEITWDPPWGPDMMSEVARLELGFL